MRLDYWLLIIYPALTLAMLLYRAKIAPARDFVEEPLSTGQTKSLQAFACIAIILHHVTQSITAYGEINKGPVTILASMGILFTSVFFFCSGYGLVYSYYNKKNYLRTFFKNRILKVLIPFWSANVLFVIVNAVTDGRSMGGAKTLRYILGWQLVNSNGWYLIEILVLYLAFYVFFGLFANKDISLVLLCAFTVGLIDFAKKRGRIDSLLDNSNGWFRGEWWYNSTIVFILGLLVARFGPVLMEKIKHRYAVWLVIFAAGFIPLFTVEEYVRKVYGYYRESMKIGGMSNSTRTLLWQIVLCLVWMIALILICMKVRFGNRILDFIGSISVEVFLTHKLFIDKFFVDTRMSHMTKYAVVLVCSIITATLMSCVNQGIYRLLGMNRKKADASNGQNSETDGNSRLSEKNDETEPATLIAYRKKLEKARKKKYLILYIALGLAAAGVLYGTVVKNVKARMDTMATLKQLENAKVGDVVELGRFDTDSSVGLEKVKWIVVDDSTGQNGQKVYILVTAEAIASAPYNQKHESVDWKKSGLRSKLNSHDFLKMFSRYDEKYLAVDEYGDVLTLMSQEEAFRYFGDDEERKLSGCETALSSGLNVNTYSKIKQWDYKSVKTSWWWLRSDGDVAVMAPVVTADGTIDAEGEYVNRPNGGVRPVVRVVPGF